MPRIVDHEARRRHIAEAVRTVVGQVGVEGATVRRVAEEAGLSAGGMRHYFDDHHGLVLFAAQTMLAAVPSRVSAHRHAELDGPTRARLMLEEMLPLDEARRVECRVWLACLARADRDPSFDELRRLGWEGERHVCRLAVCSRRGLPLPAHDGVPLEPALEAMATELQIGLDGLTLAGVTSPEELPAEQVRTLLERFLERVDGSAGG